MKKYADYSGIYQKLEWMKLYSNLKCEYGAEEEVDTLLQKLGTAIDQITAEVQTLQGDALLLAQEPDDFIKIRTLREDGIRKLPFPDADTLEDKMAGAILGRFIGCTLGVPVEGASIAAMEQLAKESGTPFPPTEYWHSVWNPDLIQYGASKRILYTKDGMHGVPTDDDITYTLLGLLILEKYGFDFTTKDVGAYWKEFLPIACTAEDIALRNLKKELPIDEIAVVNNPYCQWIGADIRSDPWAYASACQPEKAAEFAYRDAYLSHRRNGIYGEMFFSAVEAAAFGVDTAEEAIRIGLTEIPKECTLHKDVEWALSVAATVHDYKEARAAVEERFAGMHPVHTNNNACLTLFGLLMGKNDFTHVISEVVAMGLDNDCTSATAGSIMGALLGKKGIPAHWYASFENKVGSYILHQEEFALEDVIARFVKLAKENYERAREEKIC